MKELSGKTAVVTGGASGIGRAMADRFAAEGMKVVIADVDPVALAAAEAEMRANGATVASMRTDVRNGEELEALARFTVDTFGGVNVLCNNAGIGIGGGIWQQTAQDWEWMLGVNLMGVVHGIRAFVPAMIAQGDECHVVNTASAAGLTVRPFLGMYAATKHAVVALSEALYHEVKFTGAKIGVSVLCPAVVNTRIGESERNRPAGLTNDASAGNPAQMAAMEQAFRAMLATGLPPEQVAGAVVDAIREDRFYILTHEDTKARVRAKMEDILEGRNPTLTA